MTPAEIRAIRSQLGLSQAALADRIGVSRKTVQSWEYEFRNPGPRARQAISRLLENVGH